MYWKSSILLILSLLCAQQSYSSKLRNKSDSAEIVLYEYREAFFDIKFSIDTLQATQYFTFSTSSSYSKCVYFNYGPFQCYFFAEPNNVYTVSLPDFSEIEPDWKNNPYFKPLPLHVNTKTRSADVGKTELNEAIRDFNKEYDPFISKQALRYYNTEYAARRLDSFINVNYNDKIRVTDPAYYKTYLRYKKAILYYHGNRQNIDSLIYEYLVDQPLKFHVPAYRTLFSNVLSGYFDYLRRRNGFSKIYSEFTRLSLDYLREYLKNDPLLENDTILEAVLLKECYNSFYSGDMKESRLIAFTDSLKESSSLYITRKTAEFLLDRFTFLKNGYQAPHFRVIDVEGDTVSLSQDNNRLIYLGFCDLNRLDCLQEIEYLKYLQAKHNNFIHIVTFLKANNYSQLSDFASAKNVNWSVISWKNNQEVIADYRIKGLPSFFLIDRNGRILRSPAPNPSENFEYELFLILRAKGEV